MAKELENAFTGTGKNRAKYVLYIERRGDVRGDYIAVHIFNAKYAAKKFLDLLFGNDELAWDIDEDGNESDDAVVSSSGIFVRNRHGADWTLREVWEHEYSILEMGWQMPQPYRNHALAARAAITTPVEYTPDGEVKGPTQGPTKRASVSRAARTGMTTIIDIAKEIGIEPRDARAALRKAKIEKPAAGWAWNAAEIDAVTAMVKKAAGVA